LQNINLSGIISIMKQEEIITYLKHLSKVYEELGGNYLEVSICGGAALNLAGYVARVTKDINILAPENLPDIFKESIHITANYFGLKPDFINQGPVDLLKWGLPNGFESRCERLKFCPHLVFLIASRLDQIHFKLWAAIDRSWGDQHLQDLRALKPTDDELEKAVRWCFMHDTSKGFREITVDFLEKNGWGNIEKRFFK